MSIPGLFSSTIARLEQNLNLRSQNHNLIVSNITNMDTPHYKAFEMKVEAAMQRDGAGQSPIRPRRTHPGHLGSALPPSADVRILSRDDEGNAMRRDGNTVDVDREMTRLAENGLMYTASAQMIARKFQGLKSAIQGEGR